ncbi:ATP-binding cassette sub-family G member 4 [Armadillidium vulgare]|nr:ATP-binding cassette sub-family G member 4 [Armadillidium vulgare]
MKISGEILVNGKPRCLKSFQKQSCYIMQDEHLLKYLTVQESMDVAAALKLGKSCQDLSVKSTIDEILSDLGLEETKNTRVSNLSGGERKRLSIAFEIISKPPIMFLDEPTSGLDNQNSYRCISLLKKLSAEGRTIICTIHQPSARLFDKFDYVYALAEGNCVYRGSVSGVLPFLSKISLQCPHYYNPADFLIEVASGEYGNSSTALAQEVNSNLSLDGDKYNHTGKAIEQDLVSDSKDQNINGISVGYQSRGDVVYISKDETNLDFSSCHQSFLSQEEENFAHYSVPFWTQFYVLFVRTLRSIIRDPILTLTRLLVNILVGIFVGILFYDIGDDATEVLSNIGYLYFSFVFFALISMFPTVLIFPLEIKVIIREHLNNWYSLKAYYLAKTFADTPLQIVYSFIFTSIAYFMTNQPHEIERFLLIAVPRHS